MHELPVAVHYEGCRGQVGRDEWLNSELVGGRSGHPDMAPSRAHTTSTTLRQTAIANSQR